MSATRREALTAAAAAGASLALPALSRADATEDLSAASVAAVLRLEQTALVAYEALANSGLFPATLRGFLDQERQHADQLGIALDNMSAKAPIPPRRTDIRGLPAALRSKRAALRFAIALELRTVAAYQGVVRNVPDANILRTSAGAMGTDAQHLVILRELAGFDPLPRAFETGHPA